MTGTMDLLVYHNEHAGATTALNLVSCPAAYHNYWLTAEISREKNRQFHFHTEDLTLGSGSRFGYELQADLFQDPRYRFYGLGGGADEEAESNYTHKELSGAADLYWNAATHLRFTLGSRVRRTTLSRGADNLADKLPYTAAAFPDVPGVGGATVLGERLSAIYDHRNQEFNPTAGTYARLLVEADHGLSDARPSPPATYGRFSLEARHYRSTADQRFTLLLRNTWRLTTGQDDIPFFELPTLGGDTALRGFDFGRFYGKHAVFGSAELRMQAMHLVLMGFPMDMEIAPFVDLGQVFQSADFEGEFNVNPGFSFRALSRPNVGIILNGAVGQDGLIFTGGASLPF
ncbi:MAG: BamA/TamA family outer membrane protein [Candidatus Latescibacteria bacterium]|nr:BamA/TamA family outer membrane protein [Candidatus Latescibacterota bacterium]